MKTLKISFVFALLVFAGLAFSSCKSPGGEIQVPSPGLEGAGPALEVPPGTEVPPATPAVPVSPANYNLTINVLGFGTVSSASEALSGSWRGLVVISLPTNVVVELSATPDTGCAFLEWSGDCTGTSSCIVTMNGNKTVQANFETIFMEPAPIPKQLSVQFIGPTGSGKVIVTPPMVECIADCAQTYSEASPAVHLAATANPTYDFKGWGGACHGLLTTCDITLVSDYTEVTANFDVAMREVEVEYDSANTGTGRVRISAVPPSGASSSIVCTLPCRQTYPVNTVVTLTALPDTPSSYFDYWGYGECMPPDSYTCSPVTLNIDKLFRVVFKRTPITPLEPIRPRIDLGPRIPIPPSGPPAGPIGPIGPGF